MPPNRFAKIIPIRPNFCGFIDFPNPFFPPGEILAALRDYPDSFNVRCERVAVRERLQRQSSVKSA
jgi:hypothetical protein